MTPKERDRLIKHMEDFTKKLLAEGPEACQRYLISLGIYNEDGSLTVRYGGKE